MKEQGRAGHMDKKGQGLACEDLACATPGPATFVAQHSPQHPPLALPDTPNPSHSFLRVTPDPGPLLPLRRTEQGQAVANQIHAYRYMECSSKTRQNVKEVFEQATRAALTAQKIKRRNCVVL